jgi:hypothetical protein
MTGITVLCYMVPSYAFLCRPLTAGYMLFRGTWRARGCVRACHSPVALGAIPTGWTRFYELIGVKAFYDIGESGGLQNMRLLNYRFLTTGSRHLTWSPHGHSSTDQFGCWPCGTRYMSS